MRILTVGNLYPPQHLGGYELMWRAAVAGLRERGHDVKVLTTHTRLNDAPDTEPGVERTLRWYWHEHRFPYMGPLAVRALERHNRATLLRAAEDADAVSWWSMGGMSLRLIGVLDRIPALSVVHDDWLVYGPRVDRALQRRRRRLPPAERLGHGLFVSQHTLDRARAAGWAPPTAEVVHSGYDERCFEPEEPRPWRWRLLLPGRIDARKGHRAAVAALDELPEATLTIAGAGDDALAAELGRHPRVRLTGALAPDALAAAYADADAVLFPTEWEEPWGLVPLEAMAVGRPVVATGTGGSAEYLRAGRNCLLHPVADPAALAACVRRLADDAALRARLREGGLATAQRHTRSVFVERVCEAHAHAYASRG